MNEDIFRTYDIRGIVDRDFNPELIIDLGKAFGTILKENNYHTMSISGDVRHTTGILKKNFIKGALSVGVDICDMGSLPTPVNYFSLFNTDIPHSVQITGSHNPAEYNGFKLSYNKKPFYGDSIQKLKNIIKDSSYFKSDDYGTLFERMDVLDDYFDKELIAELSNNFIFNTEDNTDLDFKKYHEIVHIARTEVRNALNNKTPITTWYNYLLSI